MQKITKVVIPAAGFGTRFLPATKANPKEMLPIVDKPVIQYAAEEAVAAGIKDIIFIWNTDTMLKVILFNFCFKVFVEIIMTPFTYAAVNTIKRRENIDHYDIKTNFNPFSLKNH